MTKPVPKIYSTRFFQLITSRQFAEAERILERIKQKVHASDRNRGYFQALYGMLLTMKNSDRYSFLSTVDFSNKKQLKSYRNEFLSHMENRLHDEYDRGYFEAWSDYMKILPRIGAPASLNNKNATKQVQETGTQEGPTEDAPEEKTAKPSQSLIVDYAH